MLYVLLSEIAWVVVVLLAYLSAFPSVDLAAFVAENACLVGRVTVERDASVWYCCTLRGDVGKICIGEGTNVQDNTVVHTDRENGDTVVGKFVTVGHGCILHACTICDYAFIGMGSIVMDRAVVEENGMLAAGSLLTKAKVVRSGELWAGRPARYVRALSAEEILYIKESAANYIALSKQYTGVTDL